MIIRSISVYDELYKKQLEGTRGLTIVSENFIRLMIRDQIYPSGVEAHALDFGCGDGCISEYLLKRGYSVMASDVSESALNVTRQRLDGLGEGAFSVYMTRETGQLPSVPNHSAELVVAWEVLHWLGNKEKWLSTMAELLRILAPGGRLLLTMPTEDHYLKRYSLEIGISQYLAKTDNRMDCVLYSPNLYTLKHIFIEDFRLRIEQILRYEEGSTTTEHSLMDRFSMYGFCLKKL